MVVFPEGYHEMHNDIEFKPLMNCIKDFISKR
jgi:alpha-beta hydrolase superfamily lysophospholipase